MKNYRRAYNRQQKELKFKKRVKNWFLYLSDNPKYKKEYYLELTLKGKCHTFLKTTSRPCNCILCTYEKYKRTPKNKVIRDAFKD